jgi:hypothetical protein
MRALLFLLPVALASCGTLTTQREILKRSQAEIAAREPWSDTAVVLVEQKPDDMLKLTWRVRAGSLDTTDYPAWTGINLVPGTERELCYSRDGCLLGYSDIGSRCPETAPAPVWTEAPAPVK